MKLLKVCILILFFLYLLPLGAFCQDSHNNPTETTEHGHCVLMCHATCTHAVVLNEKVHIASFVPHLETGLSFETASYQNPSLDSLKRPPITVS